MPELPEVETIRAQLDPLLSGATIVDAWAFPSGKFDPAVLAVGGRIVGVRRRGKYLLVGLVRPAPADPTDPTDLDLDLDQDLPDRLDDELVVHLGMTGRLAIRSTGPVDPSEETSDWRRSTLRDDEPRHLRAQWRLDDGRVLWFDDVRRFGRIAVVPAGDHASLPTLAALGPEPFDPAFDAEHLRREVNRSARAIKTQLLSQRVVAGVGNIYADEALWRSGVHPASRRLTRAAAGRLRDAVRDVLAEGIANGGTTLRNYRDAAGGQGTNQRHLDCYGRAGEPCVRCGELLQRIVLDARSTVLCRNCQRRT